MMGDLSPTSACKKLPFSFGFLAENPFRKIYDRRSAAPRYTNPAGGPYLTAYKGLFRELSQKDSFCDSPSFFDQGGGGAGAGRPKARSASSAFFCLVYGFRGGFLFSARFPARRRFLSRLPSDKMLARRRCVLPPLEPGIDTVAVPDWLVTIAPLDVVPPKMAAVLASSVHRQPPL